MDLSSDPTDFVDSPESTPSPMATQTTPDTEGSSTSANTGGPNSATRRPPRKSTLTQQQKNQKRQRATQDQLVTLEQEFNKNPTPTAATRERIASEINMTERSVQIWFQNSRRRAKIKMIAKKSIENGEDCDNLPEPLRQLLAMQAMESGRPFPGQLLRRPGGPMAQYGSGGMMMNGDLTAQGKVVIQHFTCRSLSIGTWRRVGQNAMDLVIFYSPDKACITYYINNDSAGYKIEFPFAYIKSIQLEAGDTAPNANGSPPRPGGLVIELTRPPNFFMDSSNSGGFYQCGDFTEDQQASHVLSHHLGGHPKVLSGQLAKLVSLESFQNRHNPFDIHAMPASAPVSPNMGIARPASQPQVQFARPHPPHVGMFQEQFGINHNLHPGRMHPGHKRQRSRSVPIALDFSMLHGPMPTFHIQQPSPQLTPGPHDLFQTMPQQHMQTPIGPTLQIDTSAGYGMDFRQMPMSATATSPSEFASPGFFPSNPAHGPMPASDYGTPQQFNMPFLSPSPMVDAHLMSSSVSPMPHMHHPDPVIADQSPPLNALHRSASADMFSRHHDHSGLMDETLMLGEMYSKQNLNMPMPSPGIDENGMLMMHDMSEFHTPMEHMDMFMTPSGTIDPNNLQAGLHH
ncbi:hypothetical protein LTR10_020498 [Elasticomyces elasticus]|uniref:Homeobox domain-containing protein n=1 Tax=Exophiala sideris TaxID=1016849 RepID=A0ABR0J377_9EURO|nr:hypothetical protein LTR10_020498 [Elasticomyces elasticus]KAK5024702.1 hypothetical protein LTS07_008548 [Exophiala sideris]KAK5030796.1 hypothetical protein LTR13_008150 [Exophiala sideris]KAK5054337.1 hypothetical protein LTR69_008952 [Exophiala sideris]KAK5179738.1 hypothetical protein LTR44_007906 [Eurotiomycetes sp. CCFEE 6388]